MNKEQDYNKGKDFIIDPGQPFSIVTFEEKKYLELKDFLKFNTISHRIITKHNLIKYGINLINCEIKIKDKNEEKKIVTNIWFTDKKGWKVKLKK